MSAVLAAILDFSKKIFLAKLQETFDLNLKYCVLNNSVMCVNYSSVMFLLQIGLKFILSLVPMQV